MWQSFEQLFTTSNLQLGLLIGSGILAISLLVLALTRWGQSSPVWKCVILSFVAHILLMGYAYGTHLMFETPPLANVADPLRVNLVENDGESLVDTDPVDVALPPWDEAITPQVQPQLDALDRPKIDSEVVLERAELATVDSALLTAEPLSHSNSLPTPNEFLVPAPESRTNDFSMTSDKSFPPTEIARVEPSEIQIKPPAMNVKRRDQESQAAPTAPPEPTAAIDVARQEVSNDFRPAQTPAAAAAPEPMFVNDLLAKTSELRGATANVPPASAPPATDFQPLKQTQRGTKNNMQLVARTRRLADGQPLPKVYSLRTINNRLEIAQKRGGSVETEAAVNSALNWLAENQEPDGRWDAAKFGAGQETKTFGHDRKGAGADADCGITGLATLAFLAGGHTHLEGPYADNLKRAFEFLIGQQKVDGNLAGDARLFAKMYCHSMALLGLSEALALTGDHRLHGPVQRGVDYSLSSQNRIDGGWRYQPGDSGDMSQFGWQVLALHSAKLGGAVVPDAAFQQMQKFLDSCTSGVGGGLASYRPGQGPSTTMTAEALLCRYVLNKNVPEMTLMEASRRIATERPTPHQVNLYYWYYGTLAMYHAGGSDWEAWNSELKNALLLSQIKSGAEAGSWSPDGLWGGYGGRVYSTAMAALNLEVYYRYLPMAEVAENEGDSVRR